MNTSNYKSDNCTGFWLSWLTVFSACPAATMYCRYFSYQHLSMLNPTTVQASGCAGWLPSQPVLLYCNVVVLLLCHGEKSWVSFSVYCSQINHLFHFFHFLTSLKWNSRKENVGSLYLLNLDLKTISFTKSQCQNLNSNQKSLHYFWAKSGLQSDLVQVHSHWFLIHIIVSYFIKI